MDREDRPNGHVDIDIGGAVEWIVQQNVLPRIVFLGDRERDLIFFRSHDANTPRPGDHLLHGVVCYDVELLLPFTMHVRATGRAEDVNQTSSSHVPGDDLCGQSYVVEQLGKLTAGLRMQPLLLQDESLNRNNG
jgi:hypothetical protein